MNMKEDDEWCDEDLEMDMVERVNVCSITEPRVITWEDMKKAAGEDASYFKLVLAVEKKGVWMEELKAFH